ncbi:MAG: contractile injection system tape measure protein [Desulfobulbus sp.]
MTEQHLVGQAVFDIRFDSAAHTAEHREALARLIKTDLFQVLDEVFSATTTANEVLVLDRLEVDLGTVDASAYRDELPRRLRSRLEKSLHPHLLPPEHNEPSRARRLSRAQHQVEELRFFLLHGYLPWNTQQPDMAELEATLLQQVRGSNDAFLDFLRHNTHGEDLLARIVHQFSSPTVLELIAAFSSVRRDHPPTDFAGHGDAIDRGRLLELLQKAVRDEQPRQTLPPQAARMLHHAMQSGDVSALRSRWTTLLRDFAPQLREILSSHGRQAVIRRRIAEGFPEPMIRDILALLEPVEVVFLAAVTEQPELFGQAPFGEREDRLSRKRLLWELTLGYLMEERGSVFNRTSYLASLARQLATYGNVAFAELIDNMREMLDHLEIPAALKAELHGLLDALAEEPQGPPTTVEGSVSGEEQAQTRLLSREFRELLLHGSPDALRKSWQSLKDHHGLRLRDIVSQAAAEQPLRRQLAERLPEAMLGEFLRVLAPDDAVFIEAIPRQPQLFTPKTPGQHQDRNTTKTYLWELTLEYLVEERGSVFNRTSYLRHLVRQMATRSGLDQRDLLLSLCSALGEITSSPLHRQLMPLLGELLEETAPAGEPDRVAQPSGEKPALLRAAAYADGLQRILLQPDEEHRHKPLPAEPAAALAELARHFPERLLDVLQGLRDNPRLQLHLAHRLTTDEVLQLIDLFLALIQHTSQERRSAFLESVKGWAGRSANPHRYLGRVLEQLVRNQPVDCAALAGEQETVAGEIGPVRPPRISPRPDAEEQVPEEALVWELERFLAGPTWTATEKGVLQRRIGQAAERDSRWLRLLIQRHIGGHSLERLVDLLPDHLLLDAVLATQSPPSVALVQSADLLAAILPFLAERIERLALRREKWRFLLTWAQSEHSGSLFPEALRAFMAHLRQLAGWDEHYPLMEELQRLGQRLTPSLAVQVDALCRTLTQPAPVTAVPSAANTPPDPTRLVWSLDEGEDEPPESIFVANAGLVLASPYLPRLFDLLGLLHDNLFIDAGAAERAVHLLHFLAAETEAPAEPLLVLNKILCGLEPEAPVAAEIELTAREKETVEGLISGMIHNWTVLGSTSVEGFRESFLRREGILRLRDKDWHLLVEPRAYDLLLERLPWSFSVIKHSWMERAVHVDWRHGL